MKLVVVDSNIVFRALRSPNSQVREILLKDDHLFVTPNFLFAEIFKYKEKILSKSSVGEIEVYEYLSLLLRKIHFVNEELVSIGNRIGAYRLCSDVDEKDTPFVALSLELDAPLWTSDVKLQTGLVKKGFRNFFEV